MRLAFIALLALIPAAAVATTPKAVALAFDDGPSPQQSSRLLDVLRIAGVTVTFSYVGEAVDRQHPELAVASACAGHETNNHAYTHPHLRSLDDAGVTAEAGRTSAAIERATGRPPAWFWAPFLETAARVDRLVKAATDLAHFPYVRYHFISTDDWNQAQTAAATIRRNATTGITDGTIILFHEWREATLEQLPGIIAELRRQDCVFVPLSGLRNDRSSRIFPSIEQ